jgi:hypothetical protein
MKADTLSSAPIERIRSNLVGLRMPRALETLDHIVQQLERGQISCAVHRHHFNIRNDTSMA